MTTPRKALPEIHPHTILDCLIRQRFGVEYQPMICLQTGETRCHEALARFVAADGSALPPDRVFEALHDNPLLLLHAELETKRLQLAEAPTHGLLFVTLLIGVVLLVGLLNYVPALALGPIVEHLMLVSAR